MTYAHQPLQPPPLQQQLAGLRRRCHQLPAADQQQLLPPPCRHTRLALSSIQSAGITLLKCSVRWRSVQYEMHNSAMAHLLAGTSRGCTSLSIEDGATSASASCALYTR